MSEHLRLVPFAVVPMPSVIAGAAVYFAKLSDKGIEESYFSQPKPSPEAVNVDKGQFRW
jgi:hypothetical protein